MFFLQKYISNHIISSIIYKILKYNNGEKSMKVLLIIYADLESLLEKMSTYHNNPEKSSTIKMN